MCHFLNIDLSLSGIELVIRLSSLLIVEFQFTIQQSMRLWSNSRVQELLSFQHYLFFIK